MAAHHEIHLETYPVKKLVENGWVEDLPDQQGAIDMPNVQRLAADILEGGKSAFNQRREKYGFN